MLPHRLVREINLKSHSKRIGSSLRIRNYLLISIINSARRRNTSQGFAFGIRVFNDLLYDIRLLWEPNVCFLMHNLYAKSQFLFCSYYSLTLISTGSRNAPKTYPSLKELSGFEKGDVILYQLNSPKDRIFSYVEISIILI